MGIKQILLSVVAMCGIVGAGAKPATEVVAHRGYWKAEGSAQNSVASLKKAIEIEPGDRNAMCILRRTESSSCIMIRRSTGSGSTKAHTRL